ncbi:hypothetical protein [Nostoc sp. TCL26-01]|uniref:hypothetical protein n=1 Tax=Nostoc sp. TCL26-01 TaxID=2576904 RepID=UPI0015BABBEB|nr:hypothetical protein [Nostoc sp. TCL26-01]QLE55993.1 hypothetical protein FD725_10910 [Nostoc sp. TCL26-01]
MRSVDDFYLLPAAKSPMLTTVPDTCANLATALLIHYSFDLSGHNANELIKRWQRQYPPDWLHLAVIEALYQGRYKGISVQQILAFWLRRGQVVYHFNMEFERLICSKFPESLTATVPQLNFFEKVASPQPVNNTSSAQEANDEEGNQTQPIQLMNFPQESLSLETQPEDFARQAFGTKLLPISVTRPPIGQFTPQKSDRSESFTSKLKAISGDNS